jgi:lipopolysaccharide export system permease protein
MIRTLDRYLFREILGPFSISLGIFTFLLAVRPMLDYAQGLLAKSVPVPTVGFLLLTLLPQSLGLTVPMAFLAGLLMALGRLSGDREAVALLACGVSPMRLLRPVLLLAVLAGGLDMYLLVRAVPDANQTFREVSFRLLAEHSESDIKPRLFYEGFPGKVLYVQDTRPEGGWAGVMLADTSRPGRPAVTMAETGRLVLDEKARLVTIVLSNAIRYIPGSEPGVYDTAQDAQLRFSIDPVSVFGDGNMLPRGRAEMTIPDLKAEIARKTAAGISPHPEVMQWQQMFSFPVACLVFGALGLALGLHTRKEGKLGGLTLGLAVIFAYYAVMAQAESWTKGQMFPAVWARWLPNIVLGLVAIGAVYWRTRATGGEISFRPPERLVALARRLFPGRTDESSTPASSREPAGHARGVVVVIRIPQLALPRPRLLDLYVSRRYLGTIVLAFVALLGLYYLGTFMDLSEYVMKKVAPASALGWYMWYSTPKFIGYVAPIATLVAVLSTIGALTRTGELTVMRACGVSLYRVAAPLLVLALVWSGFLFMLDDRVLAVSNRKAAVLEDQIKGRPPHTVDVANRSWLASRDGRIYYYVAFDQTRKILFQLSVFEPSLSPFRLVGHTYASRVQFVDDAWQAENGWTQRFSGPTRSTREAFASRTLTLDTPDAFSSADVEPDSMTFGELRAHIQKLAASGFNLAEQRVSLQRRLAFPFVTIVMTLLGVPFAATTGRRGALYGIGLAVMLAAGYFLTMAFFEAAGDAGLLPAVIAAWATNVLFLAGAVYLTLTVRT